MRQLKKLVTMPFPTKTMAQEYARKFAEGLIVRIQKADMVVCGVTFSWVLRVYKPIEQPKPAPKPKAKKAIKKAK